MIYTQVEEHRGSFLERMKVISLVLGAAAEHEGELTIQQKLFLFRKTLGYFLPWKKVATYIVNTNGDDDA